MKNPANSKLDVTNVIAAFMQQKYPERHELIQVMQRGTIRNQVAALLLKEIADECNGKGLNPIDYMAISLQFGLAIGVLLERDRVMRARQIV